MERTVRIQAPLPHIKSVNTWLLRGDPLTLIDQALARTRRWSRSRPVCYGKGFASKTSSS